jgi:dTDP-4-dehydrorhamnose reductase
MKKKPVILVSGSDGQLGNELKVLAAKFSSFQFAFLSRTDFPIDDGKKINTVFKEQSPDYVINCAAYTAVDKAETDKEAAFRINADAPGLLAAACKKNNSKLIHISTDYVFDGTASEPYNEEGATNPLTVYGASKLEGEKNILQNDPSAIIIRTSWLYSSFGKNFVKTILKLLNEKEEINVVNDQFGSPTYAADLAMAILQIIDSGQWQQGVYHFSNNGIITWFDFAEFIKELTGRSSKVKPVPSSAYPTPATRPSYSALDTGKIRQVYNIPVRNWKDGLADCLSALLH